MGNGLKRYSGLEDLPETVFLAGNGINNYGSRPEGNSWKDLLEELGTDYSGMDRKFISDILTDRSVTYPEFFDLVQLLSDIAWKKQDVERIKAEIARRFDSWEPQDNHRLFISAARKEDLPILTTNFDLLLESSDTRIMDFIKSSKRSHGKPVPLSIRGRIRSASYPWFSYYSDRRLTAASEGFGIWHIHGMGVYPQSIRLSLSDYMGTVERARQWLHVEEGNPFGAGVFSGNWTGKDSWLELFLGKNLFIFGLSLESQEVSIRWLLIEREKFFRKFPRKRKHGWYAVVDEIDHFPEGKRLFFENLGFEVLHFPRASELYEDFWK